MRKNEPTATKRIASPIPFYDLDGNLLTGQTFLTASGEVFYYNSTTNAWVASNANAFELAGSGAYGLQFTQAETNFDTILGVKLVKAGYATQYLWVPVDNTPDVAVAEIGTLATAVAAVSLQVSRVLGLLHHNSLVDGGAGETEPTYSITKVLLSARVRVFASAVALAAATKGAADGADSEVFRYVITGEDIGTGLMKSYQMSEAL